ncbi:MAG: hypothetical protein WD314_10380 [Trueperaceae bacterium]
MDDRERIEALAADGRITREEADRLLRVLDDIDGTERELDGVDAEVARQGSASEQQVAGGAAGNPDRRAQGRPESSDSAPPPPPPPSAASDARTFGVAPEGMSWVEVQLLAGDLEIEVDEELSTPTVAGQGKGETTLEQTARGYRLRGAAGAEESTFLGRLIGGITRGNVQLWVPRGWGVRLEMKAGDVTVRGPLAFLSGHLLAGDLDADELHGVDLEVKAGDIGLALRITEGRNKVHAVAGDVRIRLLADSDVKLSGRVSIGDLTVPNEWGSSGRGLGSRFERTLGQGSGSLDLALGTGDLEVEADA